MWNDLAGYNPATFYGTTNNMINKGVKPGRIFQDSKGFKYRLVKLNSTLTGNSTVAGTVLYFMTSSSSLDNFLCTDVIATGVDTTCPFVAGVVTGVIPKSGSTTDTDTWCFVLIEGIYTGVKTANDGDIVAGDMLVASAATYGAVKRFDISTTTVPNAGTVATNTADTIVTDLNTNILPTIRLGMRKLQKSIVGYALDAEATALVTMMVKIRV